MKTNKKLMSIGYDCTVGYLFNADKESKINKYPFYEVGLFDWAVSYLLGSELIKTNYIDYCIKNKNYLIMPNDFNELCLDLGTIKYIHVELIENNVTKSLNNYINRLNYLIKKTNKLNKNYNNLDFVTSILKPNFIEEVYDINDIIKYYDLPNDLYIICNENEIINENIKKYNNIKVIKIPNKLIISDDFYDIRPQINKYLVKYFNKIYV